MSRTRQSAPITSRTAGAAQLRIEEGDVELGVVDHELRAADELEQLVRDLREARLAREVLALQPVDRLRADVDVALRDSSSGGRCGP